MDATGVMFSADRMSGAEYADYARRVEALGLDTVWVPELMGREPFAAAAHLLASTSTVEVRSVAGMDLRYHERSYQHADQDASFCGGMKDRHFWLEKNEILSLLERLGYSEVVVQALDNGHAGGPCFSVFARK